MKRILIANVLLILILIVGGSWAAYVMYQNMNYVTTDNARVAADWVSIIPTQTSKLTDWLVHTGDRVHAGDVLGTQEASPMQTRYSASITATRRGTSPASPAPGTDTATSPASTDIVTPVSGTILETAAIPGQVVSQGQPLAMVADLTKQYILSYIDEELIKDVKTGNTADVYLDAYPGMKFSGTVSRIDDVAGNVLSPAASLSSSVSPGRVVQRVPVRISIDSFQGKYVVPGMNATVKIHK
ncbi:secretion protein HlyD [Collibacillus ludicampi]|uniref:Secretion protein HlyD n=1 Tax=Collibacillus ludicampi TaxID=2771369 RepID=A0AAV4LBC8_9BACL|nr:efflux RND transporter periplasmic adaptor subunit [Collibacillus ludicampi]GIM44988.1 secretion protein HlyD [Collibacillus ludicampi]